MQEHAVFSRAQVGVDAPTVTVETHLQSGTPGFVLVGLPESALRESRTRVKSAIQNCGFGYPQERIVVNLAPADLAKEGTRYDLAIAIGILVATGAVRPESVERYEFLGELGLFGEVRSTRGCLCAGLAAARKGRTLVLPASNFSECSAYIDNVVAVRHLREVVALLRQNTMPPQPARSAPDSSPDTGKFNRIVGQEAAKRALTIAAAGGHHVLMVGPPGSGKTMLAEAFKELLPPLSTPSAVEVAAIYSAAAQPPPGPRPPLRTPHHSSSAVALVGGGPNGRPGEITLAHRGVLFLDELPHFQPSVLDHLREPLQARRIEISRARYSVTYPAAFQLIAAMNPCPAGRSCKENRCRCTPNQRQRYQARLSGPLLDRIDLHINVPEVPAHRLAETNSRTGAEEARNAITQARVRQLARSERLNSEIEGKDLVNLTDEPARAILGRASEKLDLSARSYHKMLRVALTIADLAGSDVIGQQHVAEALGYRAMDWESGLSQ